MGSRDGREVARAESWVRALSRGCSRYGGTDRTCFLFLNLLMASLRAHDRNIAHALALERQAEFVVLVSGVGNDDDVVAVAARS